MQQIPRIEDLIREYAARKAELDARGVYFLRDINDQQAEFFSKAMVVMAIYTGSAWLLRIPVAFLLAITLGLGAQGAWLGAVVDNSVRGTAIWWRFRRGRWKEIHV